MQRRPAAIMTIVSSLGIRAPLSTALTMAGGATLGFALHAGCDTPALSLDAGSSFPAALNVSVFCDNGMRLPKDGAVLTSGYNFAGASKI